MLVALRRVGARVDLLRAFLRPGCWLGRRPAPLRGASLLLAHVHPLVGCAARGWRPWGACCSPTCALQRCCAPTCALPRHLLLTHLHPAAPRAHPHPDAPPAERPPCAPPRRLLLAHLPRRVPRAHLHPLTRRLLRAHLVTVRAHCTPTFNPADALPAVSSLVSYFGPSCMF